LHGFTRRRFQGETANAHRAGTRTGIEPQRVQGGGGVERHGDFMPLAIMRDLERNARAVRQRDPGIGHEINPGTAARNAKQKLNAGQQQAVQGKDKVFPHATAAGKWHDLLAQITGDELSVTLDGKLIGSFRSPGIAHPGKRMLRLAIPRKVVVDDVMIWREN
jgi:hypothetical protein